MSVCVDSCVCVRVRLRVVWTARFDSVGVLGLLVCSYVQISVPVVCVWLCACVLA